MDVMALPPAGWYPAPDDPARERWWNGSDWSATYRDAAPQYATPAQPVDPFASHGSAPATAGYGAAQPGYGAPGAPYPYQPYQPYVAAQPKNGIATAGFIVSLVGVLIGLYGITGIVGAVLSSVGLARANEFARTGLPPVGKGLAIAGIIVGVVGAILSILWAVWVFNNTDLVESIIGGY